MSTTIGTDDDVLAFCEGNTPRRQETNPARRREPKQTTFESTNPSMVLNKIALSFAKYRKRR